VTTSDGKCVCVPKLGWFFSSGASVLNQPCDADYDGWVRGSARESLRSEDCAIADNALCTVRRIDRFELVGDDLESGAAMTVIVAEDPLVSNLPAVAELDGLLELYEADANDDFGLRSNGTAYPVVSPYYTPIGSASSTRALVARELNSLTKACAPATNGDASVDYNANLIPDIEEWHGMPPQPQVADWLQPFVHYSYFLELYEGFYVAGNPGEPGAYYVVEKSRRPAGGASLLPIPLVTDAGEGHWQSCWRRNDAAYVEPGEGTPPTIGMDFARFNQQTDEYGVPVFGHSSQFKCLSIVANSVPIDDPAMTPYRIHLSDADTQYQVNACRVDTDAFPDSLPPGNLQGGNTLTPVLACGFTSGIVGITLAVDRYDDYSDTNDYVRGCINECVDQAYLPPDERCASWPQSTCEADPSTGQLTQCYLDAGCRQCTWNETSGAWDCQEKPGDVCGACGDCLDFTTDSLHPVWQCRANDALCTGDCDECFGSGGRYQCRAKTNAPCGPDCGVCSQVSDTEYNCVFQRDRCLPRTCPAWGDCTYSTQCVESGSQARTCTDYTCNLAGECVQSNPIETQPCTRDTDGNTCGAGNTWCGSWGTCSYSSTCDETASQSRSCYRDGCVDGACGAVFTHSEAQNCGTRDTDGDRCGWQDCSGPNPPCMRTIWCASGSCSRVGSCHCEGGL
jgi:hypothetical protein